MFDKFCSSFPLFPSPCFCVTAAAPAAPPSSWMRGKRERKRHFHFRLFVRSSGGGGGHHSAAGLAALSGWGGGLNQEKREREDRIERGGNDSSSTVWSGLIVLEGSGYNCSISGKGEGGLKESEGEITAAHDESWPNRPEK